MTVLVWSTGEKALNFITSVGRRSVGEAHLGSHDIPSGTKPVDHIRSFCDHSRWKTDLILAHNFRVLDDVEF